MDLTIKLGSDILKMPRKLVKEGVSVNKEEVLAKSRADNQNEDEREKQIRGRSAILAFIGMGIVGVILMLMEMIFLDTELLSSGVYLVIIVALATQNWYLALTLKKNQWFWLSAGYTFCVLLSTLQVIRAFRSMM